MGLESGDPGSGEKRPERGENWRMPMPAATLPGRPRIASGAVGNRTADEAGPICPLSDARPFRGQASPPLTLSSRRRKKILWPVAAMTWPRRPRDAPATHRPVTPAAQRRRRLGSPSCPGHQPCDEAVRRVGDKPRPRAPETAHLSALLSVRTARAPKAVSPWGRPLDAPRLLAAEGFPMKPTRFSARNRRANPPIPPLDGGFRIPYIIARIYRSSHDRAAGKT
ncbi:hypothetical protein M2324_000483 [Rhodovulum sulfidophilum]|nr:hypothetical protein [Rhodovulum sulfidophilum]